MTDLFKCPKAIKLELKNEVDILNILNLKQVACAPRLIWSGIYRIFNTIITEYIDGKHIEFEEMSNEQKRACRKSLQMLHDVNCVHNDIRFENFIIRKSASDLEEAIIIDYGFSFITDKKESIEK